MFTTMRRIIQDVSGFDVADDGDVLLIRRAGVEDVHFIDADSSDLVEMNPGVFICERFLLDILNRAPRDAEMLRYIGDRHRGSEFHDQLLESLGDARFR